MRVLWVCVLLLGRGVFGAEDVSSRSVRSDRAEDSINVDQAFENFGQRIKKTSVEDSLDGHVSDNHQGKGKIEVRSAHQSNIQNAGENYVSSQEERLNENGFSAPRRESTVLASEPSNFQKPIDYDPTNRFTSEPLVYNPNNVGTSENQENNKGINEFKSRENQTTQPQEHQSGYVLKKHKKNTFVINVPDNEDRFGFEQQTDNASPDSLRTFEQPSFQQQESATNYSSVASGFVENHHSLATEQEPYDSKSKIQQQEEYLGPLQPIENYHTQHRETGHNYNPSTARFEDNQHAFDFDKESYDSKNTFQQPQQKIEALQQVHNYHTRPQETGHNYNPIASGFGENQHSFDTVQPTKDFKNTIQHQEQNIVPLQQAHNYPTLPQETGHNYNPITSEFVENQHSFQALQPTKDFKNTIQQQEQNYYIHSEEPEPNFTPISSAYMGIQPSLDTKKTYDSKKKVQQQEQNFVTIQPDQNYDSQHQQSGSNYSPISSRYVANSDLIIQQENVSNPIQELNHHFLPQQQIETFDTQHQQFATGFTPLSPRFEESQYYFNGQQNADISKKTVQQQDLQFPTNSQQGHNYDNQYQQSEPNYYRPTPSEYVGTNLPRGFRLEKVNYQNTIQQEQNFKPTQQVQNYNKNQNYDKQQLEQYDVSEISSRNAYEIPKLIYSLQEQNNSDWNQPSIYNHKVNSIQRQIENFEPVQQVQSVESKNQKTYNSPQQENYFDTQVRSPSAQQLPKFPVGMEEVSNVEWIVKGDTFQPSPKLTDGFENEWKAIDGVSKIDLESNQGNINNNNNEDLFAAKGTQFSEINLFTQENRNEHATNLQNIFPSKTSLEQTFRQPELKNNYAHISTLQKYYGQQNTASHTKMVPFPYNFEAEKNHNARQTNIDKSYIIKGTKQTTMKNNKTFFRKNESFPNNFYRSSQRVSKPSPFLAPPSSHRMMRFPHSVEKKASYFSNEDSDDPYSFRRSVHHSRPFVKRKITYAFKLPVLKAQPSSMTKKVSSHFGENPATFTFSTRRGQSQNNARAIQTQHGGTRGPIKSWKTQSSKQHLPLQSSPVYDKSKPWNINLQKNQHPLVSSPPYYNDLSSPTDPWGTLPASNLLQQSFQFNDTTKPTTNLHNNKDLSIDVTSPHYDDPMIQVKPWEMQSQNMQYLPPKPFQVNDYSNDNINNPWSSNPRKSQEDLTVKSPYNDGLNQINPWNMQTQFQNLPQQISQSNNNKPSISLHNNQDHNTKPYLNEGSGSPTSSWEMQGPSKMKDLQNQQDNFYNTLWSNSNQDIGVQLPQVTSLSNIQPQEIPQSSQSTNAYNMPQYNVLQEALRQESQVADQSLPSPSEVQQILANLGLKEDLRKSESVPSTTHSEEPIQESSFLTSFQANYSR